MICCGVFSILLGSICNFPSVSDALTNRGLGVAGLYAYSSVLFGSTQKGRMGYLEFVMIWIVVLTLFNSRILVRVGRLASHRIFSVRQIVNSPRGNFKPLLCVGSPVKDYHSMYFDEILLICFPFGVTQAFD
jgi:hypothetical protein